MRKKKNPNLPFIIEPLANCYRENVNQLVWYLNQISYDMISLETPNQIKVHKFVRVSQIKFLHEIKVKTVDLIY